MKKATKNLSRGREQNKNGLSIVKGMQDLKKLIDKGYNEYLISLAGGAAFSRKEITFNKRCGIFHIFNWIDSSSQKLKPTQLMDRNWTNIGEALKKRALFVNLTENNKNI